MDKRLAGPRSALLNTIDFQLDSLERIRAELRETLERTGDDGVKKALEEADRAHGVLVYQKEELTK